MLREFQLLTEQLAKKNIYYEIKSLLRDDKETVIIYVRVFTIEEYCKLCHKGKYNPMRKLKPSPHHGLCLFDIHNKLIGHELFYSFIDALNYIRNYASKSICDQ